MTAPRLSLLALILLFAVTAAAPGQDRKPSPPFTGTALPAPPRQKAPWRAPDVKLPNELLTATATLFDAGLADPRGGEYRVIDVGTGSPWNGDAGLLRTHGWVLPARPGEKQRFAVGWNGLVYPVVHVGERADLRADIRAVLDADAKQRDEFAKKRPQDDFYRFRHAWAETHSVSHTSLLPLKTCLLMRLGEGELARHWWQAWTAGMRAGTNDDAIHLRDPYLMLATDWAWALFDRTLCAHMRGDDRLALLGVRRLAEVRTAIEIEAQTRKFPRQSAFKNGQEIPHPYLGFLGQLDRLRADQERRARAGARERRIDPKDQARRIAARIDALEDVAARQWGQPGGVALNIDGTVEALVKEGEAAVEPLLRCLERDDRLTRSVRFHRDFFRHRHILSVREAAYTALVAILKTSTFDRPTGRDEAADAATARKLAASIRVYWERHKALPQSERWYRTLADDTLTTPHWLQAAANIVKQQGKPLRKKAKPSVSELLARRAEQVARAGAPGSQRRWSIGHACTLAEHLAAWDPPASVPVARKMVKACRDYIEGEGKADSDATSELGRAIARLTKRRQSAGDAQALDDYADWIRTLQPKAVSHSFRALLEPLWRHPDHPAMRAAAEALFAKADSPWAERFLRTYGTNDLFETPLLGLPGFRKRLLVELTDPRPAGTLKLNAEGYGYAAVEGVSTGGAAIHSAGDPRAPKPGSEIVFRVCDYYAWRLSRLDGTPRCELYWPLADRDRAVVQCVAFLTKYGARYKFNATVAALQEWPYTDRARMTFPTRDRPATADEAKQGLAIFALAGAKDIRALRLPFPLKAKWVTLKDYPEVLRYTPSAREDRDKIKVGTDQAGLVWQAEEAGGRRWYGFVGRYVVAKVPAAEIEFPATDDTWATLTGGIDCRLSPAAKGGVPLVRVELRNRSGRDRIVPAQFMRSEKARLALHAGLRLHLEYTPHIGPHKDPPRYEMLTPKTIAHFRAGKAVRTAGPATTFADFTFEPGAAFDVSRTGTYRLHLVFHRDDGAPAEGTSRVVEFVVGADTKR